MPQSGTGVSVEAVDPVFQTKMLEMLKQTGRPEMVVGWYHSHPGFGCWMSGKVLEGPVHDPCCAGVDINTQQSFEALNQRAVAVVIDPVQSVVRPCPMTAAFLKSACIGEGESCYRLLSPH